MQNRALAALLPAILALCAASALRAGRADEAATSALQPGADRAVERLLELRRLAGEGTPAGRRCLAAAWARLSADPASGFSDPEKVAILRGASGAPESGPCICRALADPSREVRLEALQALRRLPHAAAVPALLDLLTEAASGSDRAHLRDDAAIAREANELLEIVTNRSDYFDVLASAGEQQIAVTRWRQWWEDNRGRARPEWQQEGFRTEKVDVTLRIVSEPVVQVAVDAASVPALVECLADAKPQWIRENALELLSALPVPPSRFRDQPACAALARGIDHAEAAVRWRSAKALHAALSAGGHRGLPQMPPMPSDAGDVRDREKRDKVLAEAESQLARFATDLLKWWKTSASG